MGSITVAGTTGMWYEFEVGSYLKSLKAAGATAVSFSLRGVSNTEGWVGFDSDEGTNRPQLVIT
jgi:hypothetical protein